VQNLYELKYLLLFIRNDEKKLQESESYITTPITKNNQLQYRIILPCSPLQQLFLDQKHYV
jgi:hypothetical protein